MVARPREDEPHVGQELYIRTQQGLRPRLRVFANLLKLVNCHNARSPLRQIVETLLKRRLGLRRLQAERIGLRPRHRVNRHAGTKALEEPRRGFQRPVEIRIKRTDDRRGEPLGEFHQILRGKDVHVDGRYVRIGQRIEEMVDQSRLAHAPRRQERRVPAIVDRRPELGQLRHAVTEILWSAISRNVEWISRFHDDNIAESFTKRQLAFHAL